MLNYQRVIQRTQWAMDHPYHSYLRRHTIPLKNKSPLLRKDSCVSSAAKPSVTSLYTRLLIGFPAMDSDHPQYVYIYIVDSQAPYNHP